MTLTTRRTVHVVVAQATIVAEIEQASLTIGERSLPMEPSMAPIPLIGAPINERDAALTTLLIHRPLAFVPVTMLVNFSSKAMFEDLPCVHATILAQCNHLECTAALLLIHNHQLSLLVRSLVFFILIFCR